MSVALTWIAWTFGTALLGIVAYYALMPVSTRKKIVINGRPSMEPIKIGEMPPEVFSHFGRSAVDLQACGFIVRTYVHLFDQAPNVQAYLALWAKPSAGQMATAVVIYAQHPNGKVLARDYVEFLTKVAQKEGLAVLTSNSPALDSFDPVSSKNTISCIPTNDIQQLYRVHLFREAQLIRADDPRYIPDSGEEIESLADGMECDLRRQVESGYLVEDERTPNVFRATWIGAYALTWAEMFPFRDSRRTRATQVARRIYREALQHPLRPPEHVPVTHQSPYHLPPRRLPAIAA